MSALGKLRLGTRGSELARTQSTRSPTLCAPRVTTSSSRSSRPSGDRNRRARSARSARKAYSCARSSKRSSSGASSSPSLVQGPADEVAGGARHRRSSGARRPGRPLARAPRRASQRRRLAAAQVGARVGTASARRRVWLAHFRPDLVDRAAARQRADAHPPTRGRAASTRSCSRPRASSACGRRDARQRARRHHVYVSTRKRFVPAPAQGALASNAAATTRACSRHWPQSTTRRAAQP